MAGYFDCYHFEYKGPDRYLTKSYQKYEQSLSAAYADSANLQRSLSDVIHSLRDKPGDSDQSVGGQPARGEHWGNDGLYWRQASNDGHDEQLGFVEGYLFCHDKLARNKGGVFSNSPDQYRRLITAWYKFDEQTDEIDPKREPVAIADVLFKVRTDTR